MSLSKLATRSHLFIRNPTGLDLPQATGAGCLRMACSSRCTGIVWSGQREYTVGIFRAHARAGGGEHAALGPPFHAFEFGD